MTNNERSYVLLWTHELISGNRSHWYEHLLVNLTDTLVIEDTEVSIDNCKIQIIFMS